MQPTAWIRAAFWVGRCKDGEHERFVTLIQGAAGIGKSRLLEEARRMAIRLSFRVGAARAEPGDRRAAVP